MKFRYPMTEGSEYADRLMNLHRVDTSAMADDPRVLPANIQFAGNEPEEHQATSTEEKGDLHWFAYLLVAALLACSAIGIGFIAVRFFS